VRLCEVGKLAKDGSHMTIGLAILIAAVLFLIDRNHVWPQVWRGVKKTLKVVVVLAVIGGIVWGLDIARDKWIEARDARRAAEAEKVTEQKIAGQWAALESLSNAVCGTDKEIAVVMPLYEDVVHYFPDAGEAACVPNSSSKHQFASSEMASIPVPGCKVLLASYPQFTCQTAPDPYAAIAAQVPPTNAPRTKGRQFLRFTCTYSGVLTATQLGSLKTGEVGLNDLVTLLENNELGSIKVRTASGQIGWTGDSCFEVVYRDQSPVSKPTPKDGCVGHRDSTGACIAG
jgi:hypothetical protein